MTALRFRAENFEAVATRVPSAQDENISQESLWVVAAPPGIGYSVKVQHHPQVDACSVWLTTRGWQFLGESEPESEAVALAFAISLLYSVPGVEVYEPSERELRIQELERKGCIDEDTADRLRLEGP